MSVADERSTTNDWPDWQDAGRQVEVISEEGQLLRGVLVVDDFMSTDHDEIPLFMIQVGTAKVSFAGCQKWRYL